MYTRIVVPLDGSDVAEQALEPAIEMARAIQAPLHLVRVFDLHSGELNFGFGQVIDSIDTGQLTVEKDLAEHYLVETARLLERRGLTVSHELRFGAAAPGIAGALKTGDLLVIASHGRSGMSRWFLGSVAESVMRQVTEPILLIRAVQPRARRGSRSPLLETAAT